MYDLSKSMPSAYASLKGIPAYKDLHGTIYFYSVYEGTIVAAEIYGIPSDVEDKAQGFLGFHIHEGSSCTGTNEDPLKDTGMHYNPQNAPHPEHAGDLPPLMANHGNAWSAVYTSRFYPEDVVGKTAVLHSMPDDFRSQPSGSSGEKIACGEIKFWNDASRKSQ